MGLGMNATANLTASYGLNLLEPGDNGQKISGMQLAGGGLAPLKSNPLPEAAHYLCHLDCKCQTRRYRQLEPALILRALEPGLGTIFTADWNPDPTVQSQPMNLALPESSSDAH